MIAQTPYKLIKARTILLLLIIAGCQVLKAQQVSRYNTFSYNVNEGLLQSTISDIEIDKNNFCWISFPNGIQKFDGNSFINIPVQPGLPDDKYARFFRCANGDLLIFHYQGISKYNINADNFAWVYRQAATNQQLSVIIGEVAGVLYFYDEPTGQVLGMDCSNYKILQVFKLNLATSFSDANKIPRFSDNIIDNKVALKNGPDIYLIDLKQKKIISQSSIGALSYSYTLRMKSGYEVIYYDYKIKNALQCWNFKTNTNSSLTVLGKDDNSFSRSVIFPWQRKTLLSFNNRLFETDSSLQVLKSEIVNFQNQPAAGNLSIHKIKEDNFGNLYLQTVTGGIRKIIRNNYTVKYFGTAKPELNNILAVLPDKKNNRILTGGSGGLFIFDTLQQLIKHFQKDPGGGKDFRPNGIIKTGNGAYIVFTINSKNAWLLSSDLSSLTAIPFKTELTAEKSYTEFFGNPVLNTGTEAVFQTQQKLYRVNFQRKIITEHQFSTTYIMTGLWYNDMIISHGGNELIFLDGKTFKELKKIYFTKPNGVRCLAVSLKGEIYAGGNKGIFKIDTAGKILQEWNKSTGLPDECIYALTFDKEGALWCSTNKGIIKIDQNNHVLQITKQDGLQENEFNTNVLAVAEDGEIFFGGTNGVSSFFPSSISSFDDKLTLLFTGIRANNLVIDSSVAPWNIRTVKLPYRQNALSFDFIAMGKNNPGQYVYQYKMEKVDNEWIQNNNLQTVRYSLSPGKYVFRVYASRSFNKDAVPLEEVHITIRPPFWELWWVRAGLSVCLLALLYYIINQHYKRKFTKKLQQIENERQLKLERERISKDLHDSLGAYANAILYKTELLEHAGENRNELIGDLKFASKDIITSLRETVWALKKDEYAAEECLVRIRNFIQPLMRYYSNITFSVTGDAPSGMQLHYTRALNAVRLVQEAISNSIKHARPENVIINSSMQDGKWLLRVSDDGCGFDYPAMKEEERGNGLHNIEHRAAESDFVLTILSEINKGTSVSILI